MIVSNHTKKVLAGISQVHYFVLNRLPIFLEDLKKTLEYRKDFIIFNKLLAYLKKSYLPIVRRLIL